MGRGVSACAACDRGIALTRSVMASDDVVAGRLVRLLPEIEVQSSFCPPHRFPACPCRPAQADFISRLAAYRSQTLNVRPMVMHGARRRPRSARC